MNYQDLIQKLPEICLRGRGLSMRSHQNPISITELEFNFIYNFIVSHNLRSGYEVATAFGISALAAGLGFKETGGKLITMDSYVEEQSNDCASYQNQAATYQDADGYELAYELWQIYDVADKIKAVVGWSPADTPQALEGALPLDYVFIDAAHWDKNLILDVESVLPYLAKNFVFFGHDHHCFSKETMEKVGEMLGATPRVVFEPDDRHYNLFIVDKT